MRSKIQEPVQFSQFEAASHQFTSSTGPKVSSTFECKQPAPSHARSVRPYKWPPQISLSGRRIAMATTALPLLIEKGGVEL